VTAIRIPKAVEKKYYPLSFSQERIFVLYKLKSNSSFYNINNIREITDDFRIDILQEAINKLIQRQEAFRTNFKEINGEPVQVVKNNLKLKINSYELKENEDKEKTKKEINKIIKKYTLSPFKLETDPLLRVAVIKTKEATKKNTKYILVISMHHIISDAWSLDVFYKELAEIYNSFLEKRKAVLPKLYIQYKDYAEWEQSKENKRRLLKQKKYWLKRFKEKPNLSNLPVDFVNQGINKYEGEHVYNEIEENTLKMLRDIEKNNNVSLMMIILATLNIFLYRLTNQNNILIGTLATNRIYKELNNVIGYFGNNLAVLTKINIENNFKELLNIVKENVLNDFDNSQYSFENLKEAMNLSGISLFDLFFQVHQYEEKKYFNFDFKNKKNQIKYNTVKNNWGLHFVVLKNKVLIKSEYNSSIFKKETIEYWISDIKYLIKEIAKDPNKNILDYKVVSKENENKIKKFGEGEKASFPKNKTIYQIFKKQAENNPKKIAVQYKSNKLSYFKLQKKVENFSKILKGLKLKPGEIVIIDLEPGIYIPIAVLAIHKMNAICLIIGRDDPSEKIKHILRDTKSRILISDYNNFNFSFKEFINKINIDEKIYVSEKFSKKIKINKENGISEMKEIAFICYTSGSMGNPKGVKITHNSIINESYNKKGCVNFSIKNLSLSLPLTFLPAINYLCMSMILGLKLIIYPKNIFKNALELMINVEKDKIDLLETTPSIMLSYLELAKIKKKKIAFKNLKEIWPVGEKISLDLVEKFYKKHKKIPLRIVFGSSETNTSIGGIISKDVFSLNKIIEGKPSQNQQIYILNNDKNVIPINSLGELYVSGESLSFGYLNLPNETKKKFLPHPFKKNKKIYKTGDLARMNSDGNIEILGRIDNQIKIRGQRIELNEIKQIAIKKIKTINKVLIKVYQDENKDKQLIFYYTTNNNKKIEIKIIKNILKKNFPDYMIPGYFVYLKKFPLNRNNKIDALNLPEPTEKDIDRNKYEAPKTEIEKRIVKIWQDILDINKVSRYDNFFDLGGHSLKAIRVLARINQEFKINLGLKNIFESPYLKELSQEISKKKNQKNRVTAIRIPKAVEKKYYPLSFSQERIFVLYKLEPESLFYNINHVRRIKGKLNVEILKKTFNFLIKRHEIFKTNFKEVSGKPVQLINQNYKFKINYFNSDKIKNINERKKRNEKIIKSITRKPFKLETDNLLRVTVIKKTEEEYIFILSTHHIIWDRFSNYILFDELKKIYNSILKQKEPNLPKLIIQYKDYAQWERSKENEKRLKGQEKYWFNEFKGDLPLLELPIDKPRPVKQTYGGEEIIFFLDEELTEEIRKFIKSNNVTIFILFLAIFKLFLFRITAMKDLIIGTTMTSRGYVETENSLGFYLHTLPLRTKIDDSFNFIELLLEIKKTLLNVYKNKDYPFERLIKKLNPERDMSRNPLFNIFFEYINPISDQELEKFNGFKISNLFPDHQKFNHNNKSIKFNSNTVKFDIRFRIIEAKDKKIIVGCDYDNNIYKQETINNYFNIFKNLIKSSIKNPKQKIKNISLLRNREQINIIKCLASKKNTNINKNLIIQDRLRKSFKMNRENIAVEYGDEKIKYKELNERSNKILKKLLGFKFKKQQNIALLLENEVDMISGIIGVLKSRNIFSPFEIDEPKDRMNIMFKEIGVEYIITDSLKIRNRYKNKFKIIMIADIYKEEKKSIKNFKLPKYELDDNIYTYFTSGSTGEPKAILGQNKSLTHFIDWEIKELRLKRGTRVSQLAPISFDASLRDFFLPLMIGGIVVIPCKKKEILVENKLSKWIKSTNINILHTTPSIFKLINPQNSAFEVLKYIVLAGEKLHPFDLRAWKNKRVKIINMYGSTETTMLKTYHQIGQEDFGKDFIPIGKPMDGTKLFILDKYQKVCPFGIVGELYVSTPYGTKGYYDKALNKKNFIKNLLDKKDKVLLYRTGDLAKMHFNGDIEMIGRVDYQIKIRGVRIEPAEIEKSIMKFKGIKDVVVIAKEIKKDDDKYLIAYYIKENKKKQETVKDINKEKEEIKSKLKKMLPDYMVPSYFVRLKEFPLNQNGKLDRLNLPEPKEKDLDKNKYEAPKTEIEKKVAKIWQEVLNVKKISRNDNFFNLGGHSLKAIQVVAKVNEMFKIEVSLKNIFVNQILSEFSQVVDDEIIKKHLLKK
jgi:tyrocidine synthetase-3